jgi:cytosine deaminase
VEYQRQVGTPTPAQSSTPYDLLLKDAQLRDGARVDVGIADGIVAAMGALSHAVARQTIELGGRVVMPGLVEAHTHLDKALTVEQVENRSGTLYEAIRCMDHVHRTATVEAIRERALRAARLFVLAGTTTLRTHVDITYTTGLQNLEALLAMREAMRGMLDVQLVTLSCDLCGSAGRRTRELYEEALRLGVDAVGGAPALDRDAREHIDHVFDLAQRYDRPVDLHVDESDDPADFCLPYLAEKTIATGYAGRVMAGHCCALAAVDEAAACAAIDRVRAAGISVVTLPSANLYLQGRGDRGCVRRGITRVRELRAAGVPLCCGSDNVQDPFNPFGRGDPLLVANLFAHAGHLGSPDEQAFALDAITSSPACALGLTRYGLQTGCDADLLVLEAQSPRALLAEVPPRRLVIKRGEIVAETQVAARVHDRASAST